MSQAASNPKRRQGPRASSAAGAMRSGSRMRRRDGVEVLRVDDAQAGATLGALALIAHSPRTAGSAL
eukprot:6216008-Pyramimonas_sp.AAC.1